jgi:hypothetical protein
MPTAQTQAINVANTIISLSQQLKAIYDAYSVVQQQWNDDAIANTLNAQATAAVNTDGSLGSPDGAPNVTHPISSGLMARALSSNQVASMKTILDAYKSLIDGNAVSAQLSARAVISAAVG